MSEGFNEKEPHRQIIGLTVGTTTVPNLANKGKRAGKSSPLSQILVPPVMGPDSGFTSVSAGAGSPSVLGGAITWFGGLLALSGAELGSTFWDG